MKDIEDDDLEIFVQERPRSQLTFNIAHHIPPGIKLDDPYPQVTEQLLADPPTIEDNTIYSFGGESKKMFMSKGQLKTSSKKKAFTFSFADSQPDGSGSDIFASDNRGSFRGTFGPTGYNSGIKLSTTLLNSVVKEEKNENDEGSQGIVLFDLSAQGNGLEDEQDEDKLPAFGNSAYGLGKSSSPPTNTLMNSVLTLNIPNAPVEIPKIKAPSETSPKKSSQSSSVNTSGNSINKSQFSMDKSQLNLIVPEPVKINMEERIKRSQFQLEEKDIQSEEVERDVASDEEKHHQESVEIDKSPLHQSYASQEQQERIVAIETTINDKIELQIKSTRTTYTKTIHATSIKLLEDYFQIQFKTLLPMTAPEIFSRPLKTQKVYLDRLFEFLQREYQPFFLAYLKNSPQTPESETPEQKRWWQQAWNYGNNIISNLQKAPETKLQKLHKFVDCRIASSQKCLDARRNILELTSVNIQPCPIEQGGQLNVNKAFCLSQWLIALGRGQKYLANQKTKLATDVKNKAEYDMYNKMAKNYSTVMTKQMSLTQKQLQTMIRQLLTQ